MREERSLTLRRRTFGRRAPFAARRSARQRSSEGGRMSSTMLLDTRGRCRSPATLSSFHQGRPPRNPGQRYPADPPTVEEIIAVMRAAGDDADAVRLRGLIVVLWRAGLRISEALALNESDLDSSRGGILVRRGKGGKAPRGRHGPVGLGVAQPVAAAAGHAAGRRAVLRAARPDTWSSVGARWCPVAAAPSSRPSGCTASVRPPPTTTSHTRWRSRARACRCSSSSASSATPTRDHLGVPPGDRQHGDRSCRP